MQCLLLSVTILNSRIGHRPNSLLIIAFPSSRHAVHLSIRHFFPSLSKRTQAKKRGLSALNNSHQCILNAETHCWYTTVGGRIKSYISLTDQTQSTFLHIYINPRHKRHLIKVCFSKTLTHIHVWIWYLSRGQQEMKKRAEAIQSCTFFLSWDISAQSDEDAKQGLIDRGVKPCISGHKRFTMHKDKLKNTKRAGQMLQRLWSMGKLHTNQMDNQSAAHHTFLLSNQNNPLYAVSCN